MAQRFWVGNSGNFSDTTHWSTVTGGSSGASVPTSIDDAIFDSHSFSLTGQTVTIDVASQCAQLLFTGVTNSPTLAFNNNLDTFGNVTFVSGMSLTQSGGPYLRFKATSGTQLITTAGKTIPTNVDFNGVGGTFQLQDNFTANNSFVLHQAGTLDLNGKVFTPPQYSNNGSSSVLVLTMGAATCNPTGDWRMNGSSITVNAGTSVITMAGGTTFDGGGATWNSVIVNGTCTIKSNNTITTLTINAGKTVNFTNGTIQKVTNFVPNGSAGNVVTIQSDVAGLQGQIQLIGGGVVSADYLSVKDSYVTGNGGKAYWYAGGHSTNAGNNTGWIFADATGNATNTTFYLKNLRPAPFKPGKVIAFNNILK